jgi:hypothetical protein
MSILKSISGYFPKVPNGNKNSLFVVTKNADDRSWDVKNRINNTIVSTGLSIESAIGNAIEKGVNPNEINSESAFYLNSSPVSIENTDAFNTDANFASAITATNRSRTEIETLAQYENASVVSLANFSEEINPNSTTDRSFLPQRGSSVPPGAETPGYPLPRIEFKDRKGKKLDKDLRVKLRIPSKYFKNLTLPLSTFEGIIFPYTPSIQYEFKADYGNVNPMHSNFPVNFYQRSSFGPINISGKFSVQNETDARIYVATMIMLRAITRMRFGGARAGDSDSGAPPPVCRLSGYGSSMLDNVPVVVTNYRVEYPDSIDYFPVDITNGDRNEITSVPVVSTIALTCLPMYSRDEMQQFSVDKYLRGELKGKGFI